MIQMGALNSLNGKGFFMVLTWGWLALAVCLLGGILDNGRLGAEVLSKGITSGNESLDFLTTQTHKGVSKLAASLSISSSSNPM
jgi:hypothetical protein